ncbi:MAG: TraB/GumN family protein [Opitutales bacterium]
MIGPFLRFIRPVAWLVILAGGLQGAAPVWEVSRGDDRFFIAGTCHVIRQDSLPLHPAFDEVLDAADRIYLETDPSVLTDPGFALEMLQRARLPDGETLQSILEPDTYAALKAVLDQVGLPIIAMEQYDPFFVQATYLSILIQGDPEYRPGVEQVIIERAAAAGTPVAGLTPRDQHIAYLTEHDRAEVVAGLNQWLAESAHSIDYIDALIRAWANWDRAYLEEILVRDLKAVAPNMYQRLIVERNHAWVAKMGDFPEMPGTEAVFVGVGHCVGPDSVLRWLEARGFTVRPLAPGET